MNIRINENSWHYRLMTYFFYSHSRPKNLCAYLGTLFAIFAFVIANIIAIFMWPVTLLVHLFNPLPNDMVLPSLAIVLIEAVVLLCYIRHRAREAQSDLRSIPWYLKDIGLAWTMLPIMLPLRMLMALSRFVGMALHTLWRTISKTCFPLTYYKDKNNEH